MEENREATRSSVVSCLDRWEKTEGRIESERIER